MVGPRERLAVRATLEIGAAVVAATLAVAALEQIAPATSLGVVYLLAVMLAAVRWGEPAALGTAVVSVLALNFFFIEPRHRLTIADSHNVVALLVFLIAAAVVARLATRAHAQALEAHASADEARARQREAALLAGTASSLLGEGGRWSPPAIPGAAARIAMSSAPSPSADELAIRLPTREESCWLYAEREAWSKADAKRIAEPLADMIDAELARRRLAETAADAEAARRAEVAKTALLHSVSHDLRSPLTAITTAAAAMRSGVLDDRDRDDLLAVIESESSRLERLINDLLAVSRIEAGAVDPTIDWCDLRDVVAAAAENVRATRPDSTIEIDLPEDLPLVKADAVQLQRVFANLIENAVKFSPPDTPVKVDGGGGSRVVICVRDSGHGIPPSQRATMFEPFSRGRDGSVGTGLGLAISRGFVEANGGRLQLQAHTGPGTTFAVSFPAARRPTEAT